MVNYLQELYDYIDTHKFFDTDDKNFGNDLIEVRRELITYISNIKFTNDGWANAYTDGKDIFFTKGLGSRITCKEDIAFVFFHELGHIVKGHVKSSQRRAVLGGLLTLGAAIAGAAIDFGDADSLVDSALVGGAAIGSDLIQKKFSRNQEYEADEFAIEFMFRSGLNYGKVLDFFQRLTEMKHKHDFFSTHPTDQKRVDKLVEHITGWNNFQNKVVGNGDSFIEKYQEEVYERVKDERKKYKKREENARKLAEEKRKNRLKKLNNISEEEMVLYEKNIAEYRNSEEYKKKKAKTEKKLAEERKKFAEEYKEKKAKTEKKRAEVRKKRAEGKEPQQVVSPQELEKRHQDFEKLKNVEDAKTCVWVFGIIGVISFLFGNVITNIIGICCILLIFYFVVLMSKYKVD
ncbi:MAG: M48 family metallopeptidase [Methanobrevibacter sp. CfCl-M3]